MRNCQTGTLVLIGTLDVREFEIVGLDVVYLGTERGRR